MSRKSAVLSELERKKDILTRIGVSKIGLFGSVVREEDTSESDIDIIVDFLPTARKFRNFNQLCDVLDESFGDHYDLVTVSGLSPHIGDKILKEVVYVQLAS
jgi:predicted nucleotidyltransferase